MEMAGGLVALGRRADQGHEHPAACGHNAGIMEAPTRISISRPAADARTGG